MMNSLLILSVLIGSVFGKGIGYSGLANLNADHGGLFPVKSGRIVGGTNVAIENHPYTANIQYLGSHRCAGTIINDHCILTAAQCTFNVPDLYFTVRVGSTTSQAGGQLFQVDYIDNYPTFNPNNYHDDIAIIHVVGHLQFGPSIQPISMTAAGAGVPAGVMATLTGWGSNGEGNFTFSPVLQYARFPVLTNGVCSQLYEEPITNAMICAGFAEGGAGPCHGDYGGPLTYGNQVIGLFSWARGCGRPNTPAVYARIAYFRQWIDDHSH